MFIFLLMKMPNDQEEDFTYSKQRLEEWKIRNQRFRRKQNLQTYVWIMVAIIMLMILYFVTQFLSSPIVQNRTQTTPDSIRIDTIRITPKTFQKN